MSGLERLKALAGRLKIEAHGLYIAYRDPRLPWYARVFTALVVAHTFSPVDLIPDFIPVLGYLDDLIVTPLGVYLALKMIPQEVLDEARRQAAQAAPPGSGQYRMGIVIVAAIWLLGALLLAFLVLRLVRR